MVEHIAEHPESLKLGGQKKILTLLFCDVRGFTKISESYSAEELTRLINRLLTPLTVQILRFNGTVDKYMGDCVMAFWNAPLDDTQHAKNACRSAIEMFKEVDQLNSDLASEFGAYGGVSDFLKIGVGINSGECVVGNMGSEQRFDYSALGDTVNLAARFEGQSKTYGVDIVIGSQTAKSVDDFAMVEIDRIKVKGKSTSTNIFALVGDESIAMSHEFIIFAKNHKEMLQYYRSMDWNSCLYYLNICEQQAPVFGTRIRGFYSVFRSRISHFRKNPPVKNGLVWDGVFEATTK